jgi:alanine racemase
VVTQVKQIPKGDSIGYNRNGQAKQDTMIAIIPVGYADGLNRRLGNGKGQLFIHGEPAPIIGNICMDLTMVDVSGIASSGGDLIREGDEVIIFGDAHPVSELAREIGTIPYEVLTGISRRVKRIYYHE